MAIMIPREPPPPGPGRDAEQTLWRAFADGLSDDWFVYWSVAFLTPNAQQGEVDFLLLHREHGMLCVECKGRGVRRDGMGQWWRMDGHQEVRMSRSPHTQSSDNRHDLARMLRDRWRKQCDDPKAELAFTHGHAVAFPLAEPDDRVLQPLDSQPKILFGPGDLRHVDRWVMCACAFWQRKIRHPPEPLTDRQFKRFRKSVVHPTVRLVERLGARVDADAASLVRITDDQVQLMEHLLTQPRMRVIGGAGTGKTVLALEVARRHAAAGKRVLLVCFNKALARSLWLRVQDDELGDALHVRHFHSLCWHECKRLQGDAFEVPDDRELRRAFWQDAAPNYVLESIVAGTALLYDAIVVDEAQDFLPSWWTVLRELLVDPQHGALAVFGDAEQDIFARDAAWPDMPTFPLRINFRNTKAIAKVVQRLGRNESVSWRHCPDGVEPTTRGRRSATKDVHAIDELVGKLVQRERIAPDRIVVLTPHRRQNSLLKDRDTLGGIPLAHDALDRDGRVLHTTLGAFKGLESDVVILADLDVADPRANRRARYTAASRARHLLYVWADGDWADPDAE